MTFSNEFILNILIIINSFTKSWYYIKYTNVYIPFTHIQGSYLILKNSKLPLICVVINIKGLNI